MLRKCYDTAVFGATFLGLGAALGMDNVVVIEKGGLFGAEYVNNYKICEPVAIEPKTERGRFFLENLRRRGLVSAKGDVYSGPAVYVLSSYLKERPFDIMLMTEVTEIKKREDEYEITLFHSNGFETIYAKRILDTTTLGIGHAMCGKYKMHKCLNAIVYNPNKSELDGLHWNRQSGLFTYSLPVEWETKRQEAVEKLYRHKKEFSEKQIKIAIIASDFSCTIKRCKEKIDERFFWIPSTAYTNLIEAFDCGAQLAEEEKA